MVVTELHGEGTKKKVFLFVLSLLLIPMTKANHVVKFKVSGRGDTKGHGTGRHENVGTLTQSI
jgi:hypothetical protein